MRNVGDVVVSAWDTAVAETPDPFDASDLLLKRTYRERLDRLRRNSRGEIISRAVVIRRNMRRLPRLTLNPERLPR